MSIWILIWLVQKYKETILTPIWHAQMVINAVSKTINYQTLFPDISRSNTPDRKIIYLIPFVLILFYSSLQF
jgi:hypothetical protein